jgi:hypothetical protein
MTIGKIICFGLSNLIGAIIWNVHAGYSGDHNAAMFGGGFGMMVTLVFMTWVTAK